MKPKRTNKDFCPVCGLEWEFCECDELYPEPKQPNKNPGRDSDDELFNPY